MDGTNTLGLVTGTGVRDVQLNILGDSGKSGLLDQGPAK